MDNNLHIYELVRANLLSSIKLVYFEDPRFVVKRIDRYYAKSHSNASLEFMQGMSVVFNDMIADFSFMLPEYQQITKRILELDSFLQIKIKEYQHEK